MLAVLALLGLPGLISFIPQFTIFVASFKVYGGLAVIAIAGIILTALCVLRAGANTLFGPSRAEYDCLGDICGLEVVPLVVLGAVLVAGGLLPSLLLNTVNNEVVSLITHVQDILRSGGLM